MEKYYNIYKTLIENGEVARLPSIKIPARSTDKSKIWNSSIDRMDVLSDRYYSTPYGGLFILLANPQFSNENDIPNGTFIRIPYPFNTVLQGFIDSMRIFQAKNGFR